MRAVTAEEIRAIMPLNDPRDFQFWLLELCAQLADLNAFLRQTFAEGIEVKQRP